MKWIKRIKCLVCSKPMKKAYAEVKYRYKSGELGTAYLCEDCAKELEDPDGESV